MMVREVMTRQPVVVTAETAVKAALMLLDRHGITSMPVVDPQGAVVGVVSEADLIRESLPRDSRTHLRIAPDERHHQAQRVGDVMTPHPLTVPVEMDLAEATDLLTSTAIKSVPVLDGGRLVGMVSRRDVVHALARTDEEIRAEVVELYRALGVDWRVDVSDGDVQVDGPAGSQAKALARTAAGAVAGVMSVSVNRDAEASP
jgi:CBS domain-containing protein